MQAPKDKRRSPPGRRGPKPAFPPRTPAERRPDAIWLYGFHAVLAALANPRRSVKRVLVTKNALRRIEEAGANIPLTPEEVEPRDLDRLLGPESVHQGVALEVGPLAAHDIDDLASARLIVVLDQITDPHNVGAILRSAAAFGADAILTTGRHAPIESGVLAKAASGAADIVPIVEVVNLARGLEQLKELGFTLLGLDGEAENSIEAVLTGERIALVFGAEGKGLRRLTKENCHALARLDTPGQIKSLNVSNAAAIALYLATRHLQQAGEGQSRSVA